MDKKTVASLFLLAACLLSASPLCAEDGGAQAGGSQKPGDDGVVDADYETVD